MFFCNFVIDLSAIQEIWFAYLFDSSIYMQAVYFSFNTETDLAFNVFLSNAFPSAFRFLTEIIANSFTYVYQLTPLY